MYESVSPMELIDVCKYATWSVLTCLGLRTKGYKKLEQIRIETERLFQASMSHAKYFRKPEQGGNASTKGRDERQVSKDNEKSSIR